jgi:hypothetical protein
VSKSKAKDETPKSLNNCSICGQDIKVMAFKNTGVCCEKHRKIRDNDTAPANLAQSKGGV